MGGRGLSERGKDGEGEEGKLQTLKPPMLTLRTVVVYLYLVQFKVLCTRCCIQSILHNVQSLVTLYRCGLQNKLYFLVNNNNGSISIAP